MWKRIFIITWIWDIIGAKTAIRHSFKSVSNYSKLFLNFLFNSPNRSMVLDFWQIQFQFSGNVFILFQIYHNCTTWQRKSATWKRSDRSPFLTKGIGARCDNLTIRKSSVKSSLILWIESLTTLKCSGITACAKLTVASNGKNAVSQKRLADVWGTYNLVAFKFTLGAVGSLVPQ